MSNGVTLSSPHVRPATYLDLGHLLPLRAADVAEIEATGRDPVQALYESYRVSKPHVFTIWIDKEPCGIFGAAQGPWLGGGIPWMLGNEKLVSIPRQLIVEGRVWIDYLNSIYPHLENYVDARNSVSIRWLKAMGFVFPGEAVTLPHGQEFRRFTRDV